MGLFSMGEKNISETNNYDQSTTTDQSVGAGGGSGSVNLGTGASYTVNTSDADVTNAALEAMSGASRAVRDQAIASGWMNLYGAQTAILGMGKSADTAIGAAERIAGYSIENSTGLAEKSFSLTKFLADLIFGNEGRALRDNAETNQAAFLTAQSLGNNAQNLGSAALSAATNLGANAFGAASHMADSSNATALGMSVRNATMLENLGGGAYALAASVATDSRDLAQAAFDSSQDTIRQVTDMADSSQSRMADLVTATQSYNTDLAKTAATGGATDLLKTFMWVAIAALAAFALRRKP